VLEEAVHLSDRRRQTEQDRLESTLREMAQFSHKIPALWPTRPLRASVSIGIANNTRRLLRARALDRPEAAHAVDAAAGGRGGRTEPNAWEWGAVEMARRAEKHWRRSMAPPVYVAPTRLGLSSSSAAGGVERGPRQDARAEGGGESLDLPIRWRRHVLVPALERGSMPRRSCLPAGAPRVVEQAGLSNQHEMGGRVMGLPLGDLFQGSANVDGAGTRACGGRARGWGRPAPNRS